MGLFALSLYESERRMKEIAIRKINGASTRNLVVLLSSDFTKWVILAFVLACPISYYFMNKWLENFIYQTLISWWIFLATGLLTLFITWITISFQSIKAAFKNPVISLRNH
jgi:putative ABC transport system permease protein